MADILKRIIILPMVQMMPESRFEKGLESMSRAAMWSTWVWASAAPSCMGATFDICKVKETEFMYKSKAL